MGNVSTTDLHGPNRPRRPDQEPVARRPSPSRRAWRAALSASSASRAICASASVRTIDLDATGVWTSGRTDADAQIAREADEADKAARQARRDGDGRRATGS